ncbi:hypothetical protein [Cypionkella sp.]|jgi:hypothetical protein|uniref:hypothetical protein n=1 Tax=Cypionkella sp. TaxID=2811411 RepID=UPI00271D3F3C|nr:hypothetical protein [Cypionkella sp.]MDO8984007.1 hypothetical protein [Cypionkella sp.]MDP2049207.1 hypothetical protein [Cypionkella sp.]
MTKHLVDHRTASEGGRLQNFLRLERSQSATAPRTLHQRPQTRSNANSRLQHYLRIERGEQV